VIAATNRDLAAEVKAGRFREDLYYRLHVVELVVPPLRTRRGDIAQLAREFARKYSERYGLGYVVQLAPELIDELERQSWPGNVRQLENAVARRVALATTRVLGPESEPVPIERVEGEEVPADGGPSFREQVEAFERNLLRHAMQVSGNNQSEAARRLQMGRATLYDKLKKHGLA